LPSANCWRKRCLGSVKVLTEILALVNPAAFSRASRIHQTVLGIVRQLKLPDAWSYEIAAMLSQIGCVALDYFLQRNEVGRGTGQGLALAHTIIVKKHGGQIWFQSDEGRGTTFFVRLPLGGKGRAEELSPVAATGNA
jgi:hypothetical protein